MNTTIPDLTFLDDPEPQVEHRVPPEPAAPDSPVVYVVVASSDPAAVGGTWHADGTFRYPPRTQQVTDL